MQNEPFITNTVYHWRSLQKYPYVYLSITINPNWLDWERGCLRPCRTIQSSLTTNLGWDAGQTMRMDSLHLESLMDRSKSRTQTAFHINSIMLSRCVKHPFIYYQTWFWHKTLHLDLPLHISIKFTEITPKLEQSITKFDSKCNFSLLFFLNIAADHNIVSSDPFPYNL